MIPSICEYLPFFQGSGLNIVSDGDDRSPLLVMVYQKHNIRSDKLVGTLNVSIGGALEILKDGGTIAFCTSCSTDASSAIKVLEDQLRNDTSDESDPSGITIKFALAAEPRENVAADERQAIHAVALATEAISPLSSTPAAVGLLSSVVNTGTNIATNVQSFETTRVWTVLMKRIELLNRIVTDVAEVFGAQRLDLIVSMSVRYTRMHP